MSQRNADPWFERARCVTDQVATETFFASHPNQVERAQRFCASCPVAQECLNLAMSNERDYARYGIYGGLTPDQRKELWQAIRH